MKGGANNQRERLQKGWSIIQHEMTGQNTIGKGRTEERTSIFWGLIVGSITTQAPPLSSPPVI